jgi:hypothetical protein
MNGQERLYETLEYREEEKGNGILSLAVKIQRRHPDERE